MNEQLLDILLNAKDWLTAAQIADKGKWRSEANVSLQLKQLQGQSRAVCRKSATVKDAKDRPALEWRHPDLARAECEGEAAHIAGSPTEPAPVTTSALEQNLAEQLQAHKDLAAAAAAEVAEVQAERDQLQATLAEVSETLGYAKEAMKAQGGIITQLRQELAARDQASALVAPTGYAVAVPGRPLRRFTKPESATRRAVAAARGKSGRSEVFALIPIGRAQRSAEWQATHPTAA
ncbi:hypothetical protein [Cupriavidus sp. YAF13]|uniref:hypothetical protein n=1 Tax=Cupriavidus sp. YAF13 TaxID=3233075 RepID=UPI003F9191DB